MSELIPYQPSEEAILKKDAKSAVSDVLSYHIGKEAEGMDESEREVLDKERLPIYFDALTRGYEAFRTSENPREIRLTIVPQKIYKEYVVAGNDATWRYTTASDDPFERLELADLLKRHNETSTGEINIWKDRYIINEMLQEGFKAQENLTNRYMHIVATLKQRSPYLQKVFRNAPTISSELSEIRGMYQSGDEGGLSDSDIKARFIGEILVENKERSNSGDQAEAFVRNAEDALTIVQRLDNLFDKDTRKATDSSEDQFITTLAVKLLAEPKTIRGSSAFAQALSDRPELIAKVNELLQNIKTNHPPDQLKYLANLMVRTQIEEDNVVLGNAFEERGIPADIGIEYMGNLLSEKVASLIERGQVDSTSLRILKKYFTHETKKGKRDVLYDSKDLAMRIAQKGILVDAPLRAGSPEFRQQVFKEVFSLENIKNKVLMQKAVQTLFSRFNIVYETDSRRFIKKRTSADSRSSMRGDWATDEDVSHLFSTIASSLIEEDNVMGDVMTEYILKKTAGMFLKDQDLPDNQPAYLEKTDSLFWVAYPFEKGRPVALEERIESFVENASGFMTARLYDPNSEGTADARTIIKSIITNAYQHSVQHKYKLVTDATVQEIAGRILSRVNELDYALRERVLFTDGAEPNKTIIEKILANTIQGINRHTADRSNTIG